MTLDDLERQNRVIFIFYNFLGDFGMRNTFQKRTARKSIEIDMENCVERRFLDFLGSRKPAHEGIKERYPLKVVILPLLASLL